MIPDPSEFSFDKNRAPSRMTVRNTFISGKAWCRPPDSLLSGDGVHVWLRLLEPEAIASDWLVLSETEKERSQRYLYSHDRNNWVQARAFWRKVLAKHLRCPPESIEVETSQHGAYHVRPFIHQTLSHTHGIVLAAVSVSAMIGIDVEHIRDMDYWAVASSSFTEDEKASLSESIDKRRDFFRIWTKKEAWSKALGMGLHIPFNILEVNLKKKCSLTKSLAPFPDIKSWELLEIDVGASHVASIAYSSPATQVHFWLFDS